MDNDPMDTGSNNNMDYQYEYADHNDNNSSVNQRGSNMTSMANSSISNQRMRALTIPLTSFFLPDDNSSTSMEKLYNEYAKRINVHLGAKINNRSSEVISTDERSVVQTQQAINTLRTKLENERNEEITAIQNHIAGPTGLAIDYSKLELDYKRQFFNPSFLAFMSTIIRTITLPEFMRYDKAGTSSTNIKREQLRRTRHWITSLKTIASGAFGRTLVAGIVNVDSFLALKYPLRSDIDQRHEYLVGMSVNNLRDLGWCQNVVYTLGLFRCNGAKVVEGKEKGDVIGWCTAESNSSYIVIENIENQGTLGDIISQQYSILDPPLVVSFIIQQVLTLFQLESIGVTHWDAHCFNWIPQPTDFQNNIVRFATDDGYYYVKTAGFIIKLIDFGLASYSVGGTYVGPDVKTQVNTSCYFEGRPVPLADVYRVFMHWYYELMARVIGRGHGKLIHTKLAEFLEDVLGNYFKLRTPAQFSYNRGLIRSNNTTTANRNKMLNELRDLNFARIDSVDRTLKYRDIRDFLKMFFSPNSPLTEYYANWRDIASSSIPEGSMTQLFCGDKTVCKLPNNIANDYLRRPLDYYEIDLYRINTTTIDNDKIEVIVNNTLFQIDGYAAVVEDSIAKITNTPMPKIPTNIQLNTFMNIRLNIERYLDAIIQWWVAEGEISLLSDIVKRIGNPPNAVFVVDRINLYAKDRNLKLYDDAVKTVTDTNKLVQPLANKFFTVEDESEEKTIVMETLRSFTFAVETLKDSNFPISSASSSIKK